MVRILWIIGIIMISIGIGLSVLFFSSTNKNAVASDIHNPQIITITKGMTDRMITQTLNRKGIIDRGILFTMIRVFDSTPKPGGYELSPEMSVFEISQVLNQEPAHILINIPSGTTKDEVINHIGIAFNWTDTDKQTFKKAYNAMQWNAFNEPASHVFLELFGWSEYEREAFMTRGAFFQDPQLDIFKYTHVPGQYLIPRDSTKAQIAAHLIREVTQTHYPNIELFLKESLDPSITKAVLAFVQEELELLPDLIPLAPNDIGLERKYDGTHLVFSTTYWNAGSGPLELVADPETRGVAGDIARDVFQRVYKTDGTFRDVISGNFLWHQEHLHYHYSDFVEYIFESVDAPATISRNSSDNFQQKATFCVRDVTKVSAIGLGTPGTAQYQICGKERQGISVGWGDTYFFTYADQSINIDNIPSGRYRLSFLVNPKNRIEEETKENNRSWAILDINMEEEAVTIVELFPKQEVELEHVYVD